MHWVTENPWPLVVLLCGAAVCALILMGQHRWLAGILLFAGAGGVWWADILVVTPAEEVEVALQRMLDAFIDEDLTTIRSLISENSPDLVQTAEAGLDLVTLGPSFHLKNLQVETSGGGLTATASLRANGSAMLKRGSMQTHVATRWRTTWKREGGSWKLSGVIRLDPVTGQPVDPLSAR